MLPRHILSPESWEGRLMRRRNLNADSWFGYCSPLMPGLNVAPNRPESQEKHKKTSLSHVNIQKAGSYFHNQNGFTLTELLIVLAIIAILSTAGMMSYIIARDKAKVASCYVSLDAVKEGLEGYSIEHNGYPAPEGINTLADLSEKLREYVDFSPRSTCDNNITYQSEAGAYQITTAVHYTGGNGAFGVRLVLENGEIREEPM